MFLEPLVIKFPPWASVKMVFSDGDIYGQLLVIFVEIADITNNNKYTIYIQDISEDRQTNVTS